MAIYSREHAHQTAQLMKYGEIVRDLAQRRASWSYYDTQFWMLRESMIIPWDRIHTEFWIMSTSQPTPQSFRSSHKHNRNNTQNRSGRYLQNTCWVYNKRTHCHNQQCPHSHVCSYCRGHHPATKCSYNSKEHAAQSRAVSTATSKISPSAFSLQVWGTGLVCPTNASSFIQITTRLYTRTSKDAQIMILVRRLVLACMQHNILVKSVHIPHLT